MSNLWRGASRDSIAYRHAFRFTWLQMWNLWPVDKERREFETTYSAGSQRRKVYDWGSQWSNSNSLRRALFSSRPYPCTICNVSFKTSTHLKRHNRKHTQERNYECQYCHRSFIDAGTRDRHSVLHIQERSIECQFCSKLFMTHVRLLVAALYSST